MVTDGGSLRVATWNVYLGADLPTLLSAVRTDRLPELAATALRQARRTRFPERAEVIADVIADARPDVVGLQEIGSWDVRDATGRQRLWDHQQLLLDALEIRGEPYVVLHCSDTFAGTLPLPDGRELDFTNCDAMLLRAHPDREITVVDAAAGHYDACHHVALTPDVTLRARRGWVQADLQVVGLPVRVVTTHLDSMDTGVRDRQAHELVSLISPSTVPVVVVGDFGPGATDVASEVLGRAGYADAWDQVGDGEGSTWGRSGDLIDEQALSVRRDLVMYDARGVRAVAVELIGTDASARTPGDSPLWPSAHAGVTADLALG